MTGLGRRLPHGLVEIRQCGFISGIARPAGGVASEPPVVTGRFRVTNWVSSIIPRTSGDSQRRSVPCSELRTCRHPRSLARMPAELPEAGCGQYHL